MQVCEKHINAIGDMQGSMQETKKHRSNAILPWGPRLIVYSYLDIHETAQKVSALSRKERKNVLDSEIARKGKTLLITIDVKDQEQGWLTTRDASQLFRHFEKPIRLTDIIILHCRCSEEETPADRV